MADDSKRKPSWATLMALTLVVAGVGAFVLFGGPRWLTTSATPAPSAPATSPSASPSAKPSPSSSALPWPTRSPSTTKKFQTLIVEPYKLLGRVRDRNTSVGGDVRRWMPFADIKPVSATYGSHKAKNRVSFIATTSKLLGQPEVEAEAMMTRVLAAMGKYERVVIDPGPLGGAAVCAVLGRTLLICFWADEGSLGMIDLTSAGTIDVAKKQFIQARGQIEHKVPR